MYHWPSAAVNNRENRADEVDPLNGPSCGGQMRIIAFIGVRSCFLLVLVTPRKKAKNKT